MDDDEFNAPFRGWIAAVEGRGVLVGAVVLLAVQAIVRAYVKFGSWFTGDDIAFIARAEGLPLLSSEYLLEDWNGHLMPGAFVWVRFLHALWPLDYSAVAVSDLALQATAGALAYLLLVELFGRRPAILVPLAFFLFSPITLPAFAWWAAALNQLFGQVAMTACLLFHVRFHRSGRVRTGILGAACLAGGLAFSEKLLLAVPLVFAMTIFYFSAGPPVRRVRAVLWRYRAIWAAYAVVVVPYLALYGTRVASPVDGRSSLELTLDTLGTSFGRALLPASFGGPWRWTRVGFNGAVADPGSTMATLAAVAASLVVWFSVLRRRRAAFGWFVVAGYAFVNAVLVGMTRAPSVGSIVGAEYRYSTDIALVIAVFGALAMLPIVDGAQQGVVQRLRPRFPHPLRPALNPGIGPRFVELAVAGALACVLVVSSTASSFGFASVWKNSAVRDYFANAEHDYAHRSGPLTIADTLMPEAIHSSLFDEWSTTTAVMAAFEPRPHFLLPGSSTDNLVVPDASGHLRPALIEGVTNMNGPRMDCGYYVGTGSVTIPLREETFPWRWFVRIGYIASADATTVVHAGSITSAATIHVGLNKLFVLGEGAMTSITLEGLSAGGLCTDDVTVGAITPLPDQAP